MVEAGGALAMEQEGEGCGLGEDADVGCDGEAFEAQGVEETGVDRDGKHGNYGAGNGGGAGVAGGVEGTGIDALHSPDGQGDGKDAEEVCGAGGVGVVELA